MRCTFNQLLRGEADLPRQYAAGEIPEPSRLEIPAMLRRERVRIARELHDQVVQDLIVTVMSLRGLVFPRTADIDEKPILQAAAAADRALASARRFLGDLRKLDLQSQVADPPVCLDDIVLPIMATVRTAARVEINRTALRAVMLSARTAREVDMILREAVTNAIRHGGAGMITCSVSVGAGCVSLEVSDDGCGFEPAEGVLGFGLLGMVERATALGATVEVRSRPGCGTVVRLRLTDVSISDE